MAGEAAAGGHRSCSVLFRLSLPLRLRSSMRRRPLFPVGFGSRRTGMVPTGSPDIGHNSSRQSASARAIRADTDAFLVADALGAAGLTIVEDVDGVYDADPSAAGGTTARLIRETTAADHAARRAGAGYLDIKRAMSEVCAALSLGVA
jgi:acetylglutamate kinase